MKRLLLLIAFAPNFGWTQTAAEVLGKAISYHDADETWSELACTFHFVETRPDGDDRKATFKMDNAKGSWRLNRNDTEVYEIKSESATVLKGGKDEARGLMLRNYYLYLWGLPMKLRDESTPEITVSEGTNSKGIDTYVLRVPYSAEVYYFYIDKASGRMLEYKFYKDEAAGKGELIKLEEEVAFAGLRIPKRRSWYTLPEMKYLGTDILDKIE